MAEHVSSEDPSIRTVRARIQRHGATDRPVLTLPPEAAAHVPVGVVRLALGGSTYHAAVRAGEEGPVIAGAYDNARLARSPGDGPNRLPGWLDEVGLGIGRSVLVDVVVPDFLYGVRPPGATAVYEAVEPPASSLTDIATSLDG